MIVAPDLPAAVGNTPLIRLRRASEATGCEIWGKAEFMNPGQSVKDRAALWIIRDAVARGALRPGGTIVEGTAGNTGIGLALIGAAMGFRTVIVIPDTQSQEKKDMIRLAGATLVEVPAVPYRDPNNYVRYSGRLAEKLAARGPGRRGLGEPVRQRRQPPGPRRRHRARDLGADRGPRRRLHLRRRLGRHARRRRRRAPRPRPRGPHRPRRPRRARRSTATTPPASSKAEGTSITEGIGQGRITANLEGLAVDMPYRIPDAEAVAQVFDLLHHEGLCLGASSGHQRRRRRCAWPASSGPGTASSPSSATSAPATSRSSSTPSSCARRACRSPTGSSARAATSPMPGRTDPLAAPGAARPRPLRDPRPRDRRGRRRRPRRPPPSSAGTRSPPRPRREVADATTTHRRPRPAARAARRPAGRDRRGRADRTSPPSTS